MMKSDNPSMTVFSIALVQAHGGIDSHWAGVVDETRRRVLAWAMVSSREQRGKYYLNDAAKLDKPANFHGQQPFLRHR